MDHDVWGPRHAVELSSDEQENREEALAVLLGSRAAELYGVERVVKGASDEKADWDVVASLAWLREAEANAGTVFDEQRWITHQAQFFLWRGVVGGG
jgi:hypothetical protein